MKEQDEELKKLRGALYRDVSDIDVMKWKKSVRERKTLLSRTMQNRWFQWTVAASFGFLLGAVVFSTRGPVSSSQKISYEEDATFEHIYINDR